jgi:hypothetical protein
MTGRLSRPRMDADDQLLRAALLSGDAGREAWEHAKREPDLIDRAPYRILPQLYRNLRDLGVDDPEMPRLKGIYRHAWVSNQRLLADGQAVVAELHAAGIETLVIGGAALATRYYTDATRRPIETFDVLVHAADAPRAAAKPLDRLMRVSNSIALERIALHWSPFWEPVPEDDIWRASGLDPAHELMRAIVGGGPVPPARFRWVPDALAVLRSGDPDWERLVGDAERWCMSARLAGPLDTLRSAFEAAVPAAAIEQLRRARRPFHERAAHAASRKPVRGGYHVLHWHRYRRLRAVTPEAASSFRRYWRDSVGADSWGAVARRYAGRLTSA